jgi:CBS domain-containing protein
MDDLLEGDMLPRDVVPVGPEAFMLHFRSDAVTGIAVALGVSPEPVYRERDSTREARIIILIVAPPGDSGAAQFLQVQGALARAFSQAEIVEGLLAARTAEDILAVAPLAQIILPGNLTVREVMTRDVVSLPSGATVADAAALMAGNEMGVVPVVNEASQVVGMISYRELLTYLLPGYVKRISGETKTLGAGGKAAKDPRTLFVKQVMDRSVLCVSEEQTLAEVANIMVNKKVDRLPVVREGVLVGFITQTDIVRRVMSER